MNPRDSPLKRTLFLKGPGWYRGDLHAHSQHSDAAWGIADLVAFAEQQQLEFVTLSDHNTVSGLAEFQTYHSTDLLTLNAFELTTFHGHALALGVEKLLEWRVSPPDGPAHTMREIAAAVEETGGLFVIAHPMSLGSPWCSGCHWNYADMMPGTARAVEVWNSAWDSDRFNEQALQLYYLWLNQGYRLVATAGTDSHRPPEAGAKLGFNVVYAEEFSQKGLLTAVERGHLYLSGGPTLDLSARNAAGEVFKIGDVVTGNDVGVSLRWRGCVPGETVRVIADGKVHKTLTEASAGNHTFTFATLPAWLTVEIRDAQNNLRALSNPLFFQVPFREAALRNTPRPLAPRLLAPRLRNAPAPVALAAPRLYPHRGGRVLLVRPRLRRTRPAAVAALAHFREALFGTAPAAARGQQGSHLQRRHASHAFSRCKNAPRTRVIGRYTGYWSATKTC